MELPKPRKQENGTKATHSKLRREEDIIMLKKTVAHDATLPVCRAYADTSGRRGICTFVRKRLTAIMQQRNKGKKPEY
ncbi:hypothetical protein HPB48_008826 [Haemaphysalis longicornis]|uniref:Uncharacterized protein n=1 Tax=Haemaphysalis longicornis TaxID=44386 RepID=A0A9J6FKR3_HAELO|nr:hypothetical protein HPB48_008826 [Haemaphysalis longicornis]